MSSHILPYTIRLLFVIVTIFVFATILFIIVKDLTLIHSSGTAEIQLVVYRIFFSTQKPGPWHSPGHTDNDCSINVLRGIGARHARLHSIGC